MATKTQTAARKKSPARNPDPSGAAASTQLAQDKPVNVFAPFGDIEQVFERAFEHFLPHKWISPLRWELPYWGELPMPFEGKQPRVDVIDHDSNVVVKAELPGVEKNDIDISMTANTVTINVTDTHKKEETKGDYYRCEISRGAFSRTVALPCDVDGSKANANFKNGMLELTIPKVEQSKRRRITIQ